MPTRDEHYDRRIEILTEKLDKLLYKLNEEMALRDLWLIEQGYSPMQAYPPRTKYDRTISMLEKLERDIVERIHKAEKRRHSPPSLLERMLRWE